MATETATETATAAATAATVARAGLTLQEFLAAHPWPEDMAARGRPLDFLWHFELAVSDVELWPWVSDTSRFNRALKTARMEFWEKDGVRYGRARNGGFLQEWVEVPWTWVARRSLQSIRSYSRGFAHFVRAIYLIEPLAEGRVRLTVYFGWIPRGGFGRTMLRLFFPSFQGGYRRVLAEIEQHVRAARPEGSPYRAPPHQLGPEARARLEALTAEVAARLPPAAELGTEPAALLEQLRAHIASGDDMELTRLHVRPLARAFGVPERALLVACLHATRRGLLELSWDVVCPHCRGVRTEAATLGDLPTDAACEPCGVAFSTDAEGSIEVSFRVHPSIRDVPEVFFCSAEPAKKPHIELCQVLAPGQRRTVATTLPAGLYRCWLKGQDSFTPLGVCTGPGEATWVAGQPPVPAEVAGGAVLTLDNPTAAPVTFVIESPGFKDDALRPAHLFGLQEFRDLFSQESLAAEVKLSIGEQTILFTDIVGSTRFYETQGDPGAFAEVRRHFTAVFDEIRKQRGVVVKTIGDAAMAAFADPLHALRAAAAIHARFDGKGASPCRLRISINTGPCMAVNLNASIDYFGRTVNMAAKLQALVEAGQIVFPRKLENAPGVRDYLTAMAARLEPVELSHKAFDQPYPAFRWDLEGVGGHTTIPLAVGRGAE